MTWQEHPAVAEARRLLKARKGPPTEADRPVRVSRPRKPLPGQLDIVGRTHGLPDIAAQAADDKEV